MKREVPFVTGEYYHIYNRGVDHRNITLDERDSDRFVLSLGSFNTDRPIGSIYEQSLRKEAEMIQGNPLVEVVCYCLNPNHYHMIVKQAVDRGISIYMRALFAGYSYYFNNRHKRSGTLFQGPFKAKHIADNDYLLHLSCYVNLNDRVHQLGPPGTKLVRSSWNDYTSGKSGLCKIDLILDQFKSKAGGSYENYATETLPQMLDKRPEYEELKQLLLE
jgi:putative transposase